MQAYNRLVAPERLVTSGPYGWVQHPIYSSYLLLFCGHCLSLAAPLTAAALTAACLLYYAQRTALEEGLLAAAFGREYELYRQRVRYKLLPGVL